MSAAGPPNTLLTRREWDAYQRGRREAEAEQRAALERAHMAGYDAGREDGVAWQRGDFVIGQAAAWQEFLAAEGGVA